MNTSIIKKILLIMFFLFLIVSCGDDPAKLRVFNTSDTKIENITIEGVEFGNLEAGKNSEYKDFDKLNYTSFVVKYTYNGEVITHDLEETELMEGKKFCIAIDGSGYMFSLEDFFTCESFKK